MPFVLRKIEPVRIRCHYNNTENDVFEEHDDVVHNAMVNVLLQLSSLSFHATEILHNVNDEIKFLNSRLDQFRDRMDRLYEKTQALNPKEVAIPMSDLSNEAKIPLHLHYRSSVHLEEEFFTSQSRSSCLINLHQSASPDVTGRITLQPNYIQSSQIVNENDIVGSSTPSFVQSTSDNTDNLVTKESILPTPEERMKLDSALHKAELVAIDTSGNQFERRVSIRRLQRSSISAVRRKSQLKYKNRQERTRSAVEISHQTGISRARRIASVVTNAASNSSFTSDTESCINRTEEVKSLPKSKPPRNNRNSMPLARTPLVPALNLSTVNDLSPNNRNLTIEKGKHQIKKDKTSFDSSNTDIQICPNTNLFNITEQTLSDRKKSAKVESRVLSGFPSESENYRLSTTSNIAMHHLEVTQALEQFLSNSPEKTSNNVKVAEDKSNASTLSIGSRLSGLPLSPLSSSFHTLEKTQKPVRSCSIDDNSVFTTTSSDSFSPNTRTSAFMNPTYECVFSQESKNIYNQNRELKSNEPLKTLFSMQNTNDKPQPHVNKAIFKKLPSSHIENNSAVAVSISTANSSKQQNVPEKKQSSYFFGPEFQLNTPLEDDASTQVSSCIPQFQSELKHRLQSEKLKNKPISKPNPPRRTSSCKIETKQSLPYMEPLSMRVSVSSVTLNPTTSIVTSPNFAQSLTELDLHSQVAITSTENTISINSSAFGKRPHDLDNSQQILMSPVVNTLNCDQQSTVDLDKKSSVNLDQQNPVKSDQQISAAFIKNNLKQLQSCYISSVPTLSTSILPLQNSRSAVKEKALKSLESSTSKTGANETRSKEIDYEIPEKPCSKTLLNNNLPEIKTSGIQSHIPIETFSSAVAAATKITVSKQIFQTLNSSSHDADSLNTDCKNDTDLSKSSAVSLKKETLKKDSEATLFIHSTSVTTAQAKITSDQSKSIKFSENSKPALKPKPKSLSVKLLNKSNTGKTSSKELKRRTASARAAFFNQSSDNFLKKSPLEGFDSIQSLNKFYKKEDSNLNKNGDDDLKNGNTGMEVDSEPTVQVQDAINNTSEKHDIRAKTPKINTPLSPISTYSFQKEDCKSENNKNIPHDRNDTNLTRKSVVERLDFIDDCNDSSSKNVSSNSSSFTNAIKKKDQNTQSDSEGLVDKNLNKTYIVSSDVAQTSSNINCDILQSEKQISAAPNENKTPGAGTTSSTENFKAFLLRSYSRSPSGSQISAAEKLQRNAFSNKMKEKASNDEKSARHRIVAMGDIRAALNSSKSHCRGIHHIDNMKHSSDRSLSSMYKPSVSHSARRYSARSQASTRPMLSIQEDAETESNKRSDENNRSEL